MEDSATITESSLLSKLQSASDLSSIHHLFSVYLRPFSDIINKPNKHSKSSKANAETSTVIRSLAKQFLSFLSKALSFIPKRLSETPKIDSCYASELFEAYKLCLSCVDSVSSAISCKPHYLQIQRVRLIHCYEIWGRYEDAQKEGFSVLEFIEKLSDKRSGKRKGGVIPELGKENCDKDIAMLVNLSPIDFIMRLYAITLSMNNLNSYSNGGNTKIPKTGNDVSVLKLLLKVEDQLQSLTTTDGLLTQMTYVPLYFTALKFLCGPLSELIISERKDVLSGLEDVSFSLKLPNIQDAFHQFGQVFLSYHSSEKERDVYEDNRRSILAVAAASFTLSFATKENVKESTNFLRHLISADWVQANGLQFLFATLHNIGIVLYRINRLKEATKSFKLCCQAAWNCVLHFCKMLTSSSDKCSSDLSEDTIAGFATEACAKSAFLLDILYQCGSNKITKIFTDSLDNWSVGQSLFDQIPTPVALIKQWVKIQCKQIKEPESGHAVPTIYSLMSSSSKISKETFGILLEQELQAYKEMKPLNPTLCKTMQTTITNILLEKIYGTKDCSLEKSRILISKGRESRAYGFEGLNDCIKYLSEAISILSDYKSKDDNGPVCHLLAEAYSLRALCTQEAEPNSKKFIQDVGNALKLWSSQEHFQSGEHAQNTLTLLCHVADFLSLKGYMEEHSNIYETMIRIFTWKNMPLQDCLTMLWQSRSLSHALCASPVNEAFIMTLSNHCNLSKSMEFWISCMKGSKSLEVGFQQSFSLISTLSSPDSCKHNHATESLTVDQVKQAASDLTNSAPVSSNSFFLAAHLYYDLSERMIAQGLMIEALYYAKEAHCLRTKLLQRNFIYSIDQQNDTVSQKRKSATGKLNLFEWRNCVSDCKEASTRNSMFCDALLIGENQTQQNNDSQMSSQETIRPKLTRNSKKVAKPLPEKKTSSRVTRSSKQKSEVTCVCDEVKCWHCLPSEIMKSNSLTSIIQMKWECIRRRLLLRLLTGIGKCLGVRGEIQKAHEVFLEGISVLVHISTFHTSRFLISNAFLAELIEKNVTGDVFAIEHASILYSICWLALKSLCGKGTRKDGCDMSLIPITTIVSGLKLSFILCREVPVLFQKVSRLLAVLYTLSPSNEAFSMLSSSSNVVSESQWASFFHQASLGTHLNHQLFSRIGKQKDQKTTDVDGSSFCGSTSLSLLKVAPESIPDLEGFVLKFFEDLPCTTIICISMIGDDFASFLKDLLPYKPPTHAWILLSRLNSDSIPIVTLLPINSILTGSSEVNEDSSSSYKKSCDKSWHCPWGHTIIDNVAPLFKTILEENYTSSSGFPLEDTKKNRSLWWNQRIKLDQLLGDLLRDVEDLWFGPWKLLLLGECSDNKHLDSLQKKLMNDLKSESKIDVHESILKVIIGGGGHAASLQEEWLSESILKKGCFVGGSKCHSHETHHVPYPTKQDLILNAISEIGKEDLADRKPVILVLDFEIQMLPWENLPVLRNQEVYRMPSFASISSTFDRCHQFQENNSSIFPMIDPLDAYYLLNPAGTSPTVDELSMALKNHDLFMYFGHGSGVQYIPGDEIQKLDGCAATLLMGCSSGSLSLNGSYTPKGAPLYYLFAGSPVIVANLWEVTDKDIDRFGKAVLDAWIKTRSSSSKDCAQCTEISDRLKNMNIDGDKRKGKKKTSRNKSVNNTCSVSCKHRPKIGSFMGQARQACTLPFLIGASPVCYGVPTVKLSLDLTSTFALLYA
ncbi:hypothetical protein L2E82_01744 [Cichorium intybus]|uniref:Uncharacterized protein n=1 Tax=Cichorium intybus TaxID=13427 RepID=A0ACB9H0D9_CICIN|nr:hypothetical protein L2E82_01744 [Cichorium intybus]